MQVSGFSIVRNAVRYDYPFLESIQSLLPLVDEMIVALGDCDDGTGVALQSLPTTKLKVIHTQWDPGLRRDGLIISQQTNLALDACQGDWCFYLQADEVLHENDLDRIDGAMRSTLDRPWIDGLSFRYHHFRADYTYRDPLPYRRQTRIVRRSCGARSYGDGCGFHIPGRRMQVASTGAWVYHYGYVKPPEFMSAKMDYFASLYDGR
jgi:glycosyltransferase involved in cell wall biosynthesis